MILQKKTANEYLKLLILLISACSGPIRAATIENREFADSVMHQRIPLVLNGVGLRTASIFKARVYVAGLYLAAKSASESEILNSSTPKQLKMIFLREIDAKSIALAWDDSIGKICEKPCDAFKPAIDQLKALMSDVKEGDAMTYQFSSEGVAVWFNEKLKGTIRHPGFPRLLLSTWIGEFPPTEKLKEGLLGKNWPT